jgi:hypothetical protein
MPDDDNATATRMAKQAAEHHAETVQKIVDEVSDAHAGAPSARVKDALQDTWADKLPNSAPPLPEKKANEYAEHISAGRDVVVVPAERLLIPESDE